MNAGIAAAERLLDEIDAAGRGRFDAWSGPPLPLASPASEEEAAAFVRAAAAARAVVLPLGRGTDVDTRPLPPRATVALSTRRLVGIEAFDPAEGVVTARAGTRVADLAAILLRDGQRLAPDVPRPGARTLGGAFAGGVGGADRLRRGTWRDAVLGTRVLGASGVVTASGGRLVKNVTGYDLFRLHAGAHGALGLVVELSLRLFPDPPHRAWLERDVEDPDAGAALLALVAATGVPATRLVVHASIDGSTIAAVHIEGRPRALAAAVHAVRGPFAPDRELRDAAAREAAERVRDVEAERPPLVELFVLPADVRSSIARVDAAAKAAGKRAELVIDPALGRLLVRLDASTEERDVAVFAGALGTAGLDARWSGAPAELRRGLAGGPPAGRDVMARLVELEDPSGTFARGRLHPSL